ncbi:putative inorganic phosphate cotransporter [Caerostris darwini]|uniref:Inorganic phosphate cotransporter n=1 Tax=Caerostris darwini TaxID=1538125 RepID=A0AAV4R3H7_9ARAC|nr:putative inorganic phosphate cotransporter [Caerostris darwini]
MDEIDEKKKRCELPGVRYLFALNAAIGYCAIYALRMNISVAIVAMVNQTAIHDKPGTNVTSDDCPAPSPHKGFSNSTEISEDGEFWKTRRSVQRQVGVRYHIVDRGYTDSPPHPFGCSPWGSNTSIAIRALEGLAQGVTLPAINYMVGQWAPDSEKGVLNTLVYAGVNVGTIVAMPLTAFLCDSGLFGGWPSAFYIIGLFGCLWFIMQPPVPWKKSCFLCHSDCRPLQNMPRLVILHHDD